MIKAISPKFYLAALLSVAFFLLPNPAKALDSSFEAMSQSGTHQFYVWCTGKSDYEERASGKDAKDAQGKLSRKAGSKCWPVWQGRKEG